MFLTRVNEDPVCDTRALRVHNRLHKKEKQSRRYEHGVSSSHEEDHFEIRNTLVTLEITLGSIRHAIPKSVFLVIRSPAKSLEPHRRRS